MRKGSRNYMLKKKYDATAKSYDALYSREQGLKYLASWSKLKNIDGIILDAGCGTLLFEEFLQSSKLIDNIGYIIGIDLSIGMLEVGRRKIESGSLSDVKIDMILADLSNIPLRTKSVDHTLSFTVVTLLENPGKGVEELKRVTKKDAIISVLKKFSFKTRFFEWEKIGETEKDFVYYARI